MGGESTVQFGIGIVQYIQDILGWAAPFFRVITELGSELFYITIILAGYWAYNKRHTIAAAAALIVSLLTCYWLKVIIANPRPDISYWYDGYGDVNFSTPSGHAQNSTVFFGWISIKAKRIYLSVISVILIFLIGISRVVLGVHYLEDVILGWGVGILLLIILVYLEPHVTKFLENKSDLLIYGSLFIFGLVATIITTAVFPPEAIPANDSFGAYGGLLMGLAIGLPIEKRYINFGIRLEDKKRLILRVVIGLAFVLGIMIILSQILSSEVLWERTLRYLIVVICGIAVWPAIFKRANL